MKQRKLIAIVCTVFLLFLACKKQSSSRIGTMQAKVDGTVIMCDSTVFLRHDLNGKLWGIAGFKKGGAGFILQFPISSGIGTFEFLKFNSQQYQNEAYFQYDFQNQFKSTSGSVTITEATNGHYAGIFSFPSKNFSGNLRSITEGSFTIDY